MSHESANADASIDEQLVAYLDGELDTEASRRIEERLASDPKAREALQQMDRTWELLDELDTSPMAESLAQTTLEMVVAGAGDDAKLLHRDQRRYRRRRWAIAGGGLIAAAAIGFLAVAWLRPDPNRQLLGNLPVLERLDEYRQIDDLKFLHMLHREGLFAEEDGHE